FGVDFMIFHKTLLLHPRIAENLTHIAGSVVWKNYHNMTVFIKLPYFIQLFYPLHGCSTCIAYKKSFGACNFPSCVSAILIGHLFEMVNDLKIRGRRN